MRDIGSCFRGIKAIHRPFCEPKPRWGIRLLPVKFWFIWWTPVWHKGRGPYISVGLFLVAIYRGY